MKILHFFRPLMLPIADINVSLPKTGIIYEIGSGSGALSNELSRHSLKRNIIGIDINREKIEYAKSNVIRTNLSFILGDATSYEFGLCSGIVCSDFLHHVPFDKQIVILENATKKLKKGGVLVVKEIDATDGVRMILSRLWDFILYPKDAIYYRSKKEWIQILEKLGLIVTVERRSIWFPGSTYLYICTKSL